MDLVAECGRERGTGLHVDHRIQDRADLVGQHRDLGCARGTCVSCPSTYDPGDQDGVVDGCPPHPGPCSCRTPFAVKRGSCCTSSEIVATGLSAKPHSGNSPRRVPTRSTSKAVVPSPAGRRPGEGDAVAPVAEVDVGELPDAGQAGEHVVRRAAARSAPRLDAGQRERALGVAAGERVEVDPHEVAGAEDRGVQAGDRSPSGERASTNATTQGSARRIPRMLTRVSRCHCPSSLPSRRRSSRRSRHARPHLRHRPRRHRQVDAARVPRPGTPPSSS